MSFSANAAIFLNSQVIPTEWQTQTGRVTQNRLTRAGNWLLSPLPYLFNGREVTLAYLAKVHPHDESIVDLSLQFVTSRPLFERRVWWKTALAGLYVATVVFWALGLLLKAIDFRFSENARDFHRAAVRHITPRKEPIFINNHGNPLVTCGDIDLCDTHSKVDDRHNAPISAVVVETDGGFRYGDDTIAISDGGYLRNPAIQKIILVGATVRASNREGRRCAFYEFLVSNNFVNLGLPVRMGDNSCPPYREGESYLFQSPQAKSIEEALAMPLPKDERGNPGKMLIYVPAPRPAVQQ